MKYNFRSTTRHLTTLLTLTLTTSSLMAEQKALLFGDSFDRTASTNLNASTDGQYGPLTGLSYGWQSYNATVDIQNNTLRMDNNASDGAQGGIVYPLHNFTDSAITDDGAFSVTVNLNFNSTGGNRWMSVGVGQSLAELQAVTNNLQATDLPADLFVGYKGTQDTLEIYNNGVLNTAETIIGGLPADPLTMRIEYSSITDFNTGSSVAYAVYFDDDTVAFTSGSFSWSGDNENYISLSANTVAASRFDNFEIRAGSTSDDVTAPTPDPMTWTTAPEMVDATSVTMTSTTAVDAEYNGVEYYFACVSGGGDDSGWQSGTTYAPANLTAGTTYEYAVKARDLSENYNETAYSTTNSVTPDYDTTPPSPSPMTWEVVPTAVSDSSITMTATTATDAEGNNVEYFFGNNTDWSHDSGWQSSPVFTDTGLTPETTYTYFVRARDLSSNTNMTDFSETASATTPAEPAALSKYYDSFDNDGLSTNVNYGGGMAIWKSNTRLFTWDDDGNLDSSENGAGNRYAAVYSTNAFSVVNGFVLEVTYKIDTIESGGASYSASFGLIADVEAVNSGHFISGDAQTSIGVSLTDRNGAQGLNEINPLTGYTNLVDASTQIITAGTNRTFSLTVEPDGSFSYSIDDQTPTTGTTAFDLSENYHFAVFEQYATGIEIQSVSLTPANVSEVGTISLEISGGTGNFSWYGEPNTSYELQVCNNLTIADWQTITNISGADADIEITTDLDEDQEFFRVKLTE